MAIVGRPCRRRDRKAVRLARSMVYAAVMTSSKTPEPRGAGAAIALLSISGAVVGAIVGQPSAGLIAGIALGVLVAVGLWLGDRRRR
ncbi:hypothetical protein FHS96_001723 [Sphingomonas zeicaulis]|uniref:hypothetical protein n=1 Tax=Sphingomonas zeicaulis TaxID=1632740 RepID=UPI003D1AF9E9